MRAVFSAICAKKVPTFLTHDCWQVAGIRFNQILHALELPHANWKDVAVFIEYGTQSGNVFSALSNQPFSTPEQGRPRLLINCLRHN